MANSPDALINKTAAHQINLVRYASTQAAEAIPFFEQLIDYINARLAREGESIASKRRLRAVLNDVESKMDQLLGAYSSQIQGLARPIAQQEIEFNEQMIAAVVDDYAVVIPTIEKAVAAIYSNPLLIGSGGGAVSFAELTEGWTAPEIKRVAQRISSGFYLGETPTQIARAISGTKRNGYKDGLLEISRRAAQTMAKTAVMDMATQAKTAFNLANDDLIVGEEVVATLDSRTSPYCFPGSTAATPIGAVNSVFKRRFDGDVIVITTAAGKKIKATPNHPILTARGWTPANEIKPRADVVYAVSVDVVDTESAKDVCVKSSIGALFDSFAEPSVGSVFVESASEVDFHGDGMGPEYEVHTAKPHRNLRNGLESSREHEIPKLGLGFVTEALLLSSLGHCGFHLVGVRLGDVAAKLVSTGAEHRIEPALTTAESGNDCVRPKPVSVKGDGGIGIGSLEHLAPSEVLHESFTLEHGGDGCGRCSVAPSDGCGGLAVSVSVDDVVSVSREFFSGHVYNLESDSGMYIADGILVHNCRSVDGKIYLYKDGPFPRPPYHRGGCRTTLSPVLSPEFDFTREGRTRPAVGEGGAQRVDAGTSYYEWLKAQPKSVQDDALGPAKADIFRNAGLSAEEFRKAATVGLNQPLTIDLLRSRNKEIAQYLDNE